MAYYIIRPGEHAVEDAAGTSLAVCEVFADAVQGEGVYAGCPAVFLRLSGCHLGCKWCDTMDIWNKSCRLSVDRLVGIFKDGGIVSRLDKGHHLVVTGGAPMLQQDALTEFLVSLNNVCRNRPFVEMENECTIPVHPGNSELWGLVDSWNNSPKLSHSGVPDAKRYNPEAIGQMSLAREAWFKFVVGGEDDWAEIEDGFIAPGYVRRSQVLLMPEGQTRSQLSPEKKQAVLEMAVRHDVRYAGRLQIDVYDNRKGV